MKTILCWDYSEQLAPDIQLESNGPFVKGIVDMKYLFLMLIVVGCVMACSWEIFRPAGEPFPGYSCRESLIHFYSNCSNEQLTKEKLDVLVRSCEESLATKVCDKELANLLYCMGRVVPGTYNEGRGIAFPVGRFVILTGQSGMKDGCDCMSFLADLKECQMRNGIFE